MKIFKSKVYPKKKYEWYSSSTTPDDFSEYDLKYINEQDPNIEAAFYWYIMGSYEGTGYLLTLKDNKWYITYCAHCSCYGPTDKINTDKPVASSLSEIKNKCTDDMWEDIECLVKLAEENGYGTIINDFITI